MTDPRVAAYASLLLDYSIGVRPGWQVLVVTTTEARPLARELSRQLAGRGAFALTRVAFGGHIPLDADWAEAAPAGLADRLAPLEQDVVDRADAAVFVLAPEQPAADADVSAQARHALRAQLTAYRARGRTGERPDVRCDFPCAAYAAWAGVSLAEYEDVFYAACLRDWAEEGLRMEPVLARFDRAEEVRLVDAGTDLRVGLAGRRGLIDDGHLNMPGGEVFFSPVEDSAEGVISFVEAARGVTGVRLAFRAGEVVEASADEGEERLLEALATDDGARRLGELGIGCNAGITRRLHNVLFDEKMAGTVHLALGYGFPVIGGRNESALHWDLITELGPGSRIECDGEVVQRDGRWAL